jgi:hypothetical protein
MVNTRRVTDRRTLHFSSLDGVLEEVDRLSSGNPPRASGNWTAGQVVEHVAKMIRFSTDGFPVPRAPLPIRLFGRLIRSRVLTRPTRAGFTPPRMFRFMLPDEGVTWPDAVDHLRTAIKRARSNRMKQASPVFGRLTHEQWEEFHCRHAELHLSFLHPQ